MSRPHQSALGPRARIPSVVAALLIAAAACTGPGASERVPADAPTVMAMAEEVGADVVRSLVRGYVPGVSGEVLLVTKPWNVMGTWGEGVRGPDDPRTSHASPWAYLARVPIILWGPGRVRSGVAAQRAVDVTDIAPTFAELLGFGFDAPDGRPLREALLRPARTSPPRLIVLVVYDGGGWDVLERWREAWPTTRRLANEGTIYVNATVGSAPTVTAPIHANMGTGAYPRVHGMPEIVARLPNGSVGEVYFDRADPRLLGSETLADAWDVAKGNEPWVGLVGFESWHLGMMGRGAAAPGGDRDVAVLWDRDEGRYWTNRGFYSLPDYLPGRGILDRHLGELDASDGARDGAWMGNDLEDDKVVPGTPAFVDYVGDTLREIVRREPIGRDSLTDLLFVNLKATDFGGHIWNMVGAEEEAVVAAQDRVLGELVSLLDEEVGRGEYVIAVTADHGQTPEPSTTGGMRIEKNKVAEVVNAHFGLDIVETSSPDDLYLRTEAMLEAGIRVQDVARFVGSLRIVDVLPDGTDLDSLPESVLQERAFAAALPGGFVEALTEAEIESLGPGGYSEGDLTTAPRFASLLGPG